MRFLHKVNAEFSPCKLTINFQLFKQKNLILKCFFIVFLVISSVKFIVNYHYSQLIIVENISAVKVSYSSRPHQSKQARMLKVIEGLCLYSVAQ